MYIDTTSAEDGSGRVVLNAAHADTASSAEKLTVNAGSSTRPVYFSGGVPVQTGTSLAVSVTGNAATATKLKTARNINLTDADGTNTGTGASFNGSAAVTLKLPATIKADIVGNLTGKADSADALTANAGSATNPVYFSGGVPVKTTYTLNKSVPSDAVFTDTTYDLATTSKDGLMSAEDKVKLNVTNIAYGVCETGGGTLSKEITLTDNSEWTLTPGSVIMVHFVNSNTVSNVTLNVNGTGDYPIWYNNAEYTSSGAAYCGYAGRTITYMFNGTHYVWLAGGYDTNSDVYLRVYRQKGSSYNKDFPLIASKTTAASLGTVGTESSKEAVYGLISDDNDNIPTTNPYSGMTKVKDLTVANDLTVTADITAKTLTASGTVTAPTFAGNLTGNAATATNATAADKLNSNAGSSTLPVYFSGGVPVATGTSLAVSVTGSAAKWTTKRNFTIGDGTNTSTAVAVDGSGNVALKLPTTIKATLTGNADTATNAAAADKLNSNAGDKNTPVYFDGGVPIACTALDLNTTGSAAKWTTARNIYIADADASNTGVAVGVDGSANATLKLPATIKATIVGNASTATNAAAADKLNANAGDKDTPVYFSGGIPVACTSLDLNTTGSAAKWTTARKITITDGTNTSTAVSLDGSTDVALKLPTTIKATLTGNADTATNADAADKLNSNAGSTTLPVYFSGGVPVATSDSLAVNITKNAATATKWATARNFTITDGTNSGTATSVNGTAAVSLKLPTTIKATIVGNVTGNVTGNATSADKLNTDAGSATVPVFFDGGIPTACTSLELNTTGSAAKWTTARKFTISDGTNSGTATSVDGSEAVTLNLPTTIKANLTGNADTATNATAADKLNSNAGDANTPVYFDGGVPVVCTSLDLNTSGNAATATKLKTARTISISDADGTNTATGTSFNGSANITVKLPATIKASLTGKATSAGTADKLASDAGDSNTPVYFSGGIPTKCTSLDLDTTGYAQKTYIAYSTTAASTVAKVAATTSNITFPTTIVEGTRVSIWFESGNTAASPTLKVGGSNAIAITPYDITWDAGQTLDFVYDSKTWAVIEAHHAAHATKADLATEATNAAAADKLNSNAGSVTVPVYFDGGIPNACTSLSLDTTGNAATATKLATARTITLSGDVSGGAKFDGSGNVTIEATVANDSHTHLYAGSATAGGSANSAVKLDTATAGDSNTPVYFTGGKPVACTSLDLNTSGNAATATKLATARTIRTNLASTSTASFDGSGNITPGVTGTLPLANGGLGATTASGGRSTLGLTYAPAVYTIDLTAYATTNFYLVHFGGGSEIELDCIIQSHGGAAAYEWNQNYIHFQLKDNGWSDSPYWLNILGQGSYHSTELTIMNIVHGNQNGLKGVYLRGGLSYTIVSNHSPSIATSTYTYGNESYGSGTTSYTTLTNATVLWTNDGSTKSSFSAPLYGAVWNDYAEYRTQKEEIKPGYCVASADNGQVYKTTEKFQACDGIVSDTFGFAIGETDNCKTPLAVAGRVLAYCEGDRYSYHSGDAVCAGPDGKVVKMTREEIREWPDRIVGIVSEIPEYETWGTGNVAVDGRIWIKVK